MTDLNKIRQIKRQYERQWLAIKGVAAIGIGLTADQQTGIIVSVVNASENIRSQIPPEIDSIPIELQISGEIKAL